MIAAFLCGAMFGWLAYRAWWVKSRTLKAEPWDVLCGEELFRFDQGDTIEIVDQTPVVLPVAEDSCASWELPRGMTVGQGF